MHYHIIGVGGSSLSGIARLLRAEGHEVSGTDQQTTGHGPHHIGSTVDAVLYSEAVTPQSAGYEELMSARERGLPTLRRIEFIAQRMEGKTGIAVASAHGKSTTTAQIAWSLTEAGADPAAFIGADLSAFGGSARSGKGKIVVAEACEWNRQFLALKPTIAVITTIDEEHLDTFPGGQSEIIEQFRLFASQVEADGFIVANADDQNVVEALTGISRRIVWFGRAKRAVYRQTLIEQTANGQLGVGVLDASDQAHYLVSPLVGVHHATNLLASFAVLAELHQPVTTVLQSVTSFPGIKRRFERYRDDSALTVIDDYAHHPTEVAATVRATRTRYPNRRIVAVFQPHTSERTTDHFEAFLSAFRLADWTIIADTYEPEGRVVPEHARSSDDVVRALRAAGSVSELGGTLAETESRVRAGLRFGDVVLIMGATKIWTLAKPLAELTVS